MYIMYMYALATSIFQFYRSSFNNDVVDLQLMVGELVVVGIVVVDLVAELLLFLLFFI